MATAQDKYQVHARQELASVESQLKDWFLTRRVAMERNIGIKEQLDASNMTGLSMNPASAVPTEKMALWSDLVRGTPELEDSLSTNAKEMKADMYLSLYDQSTDMNHECKVPGTAYLSCLKSNFGDSASSRAPKCSASFNVFDACRKSLLQQQAAATQKGLVSQDLADKRAKSLWDRRTVLLQAISGQPASAGI
jgi:hypothetical protein